MFATVNYTAAGGANAVYTVAFLSLAPEHLKVLVTYVDGSTDELAYTTEYTVNSARTQVTVIPAITSGATVKIYRETPRNLVDISASFSNGTVLKAGDLNLAVKHLLYVEQEILDRAAEETSRINDEFMREESDGGPWAGRNRRIKSVAAGVESTDVVTKSQLDTLQNSIVPLGTLDALASQGVAVDGELQYPEIIHAQCGRYAVGITNRMWAGNVAGTIFNPQATVNMTVDVENDSTTTARSTFKLPFQCLGASDITVQKYDPTHDPNTHAGGLGPVLASPADYTLSLNDSTITFTTPIAANPSGAPWYGFEITRTSAPAYLPGHPYYYWKASGVAAQSRIVYRTTTAGLGAIESFGGPDWKNPAVYHGIDSGDPRLIDDGIFIPKGILGGGAVLQLTIEGMLRCEGDQGVFGGTGLTPSGAAYTAENRTILFMLDFNSNALGAAPGVPGSPKRWEISHTMTAGSYPVAESEVWINGTAGVTETWTNGKRLACLNALPEQPFKLTYRIVTTHRPAEGTGTSAETDEAYTITATLEIPSLNGGSPTVRTWCNTDAAQNPGISSSVWKFYDSSEFDPVYPAQNGHQSYLGNTMLNFRAAITPHSVWGDDGLARMDIHNIQAVIFRNRLS